MLSQTDNILFPDRCDVIEISPQRYVYPIFKNGSGALGDLPHRTVNISQLTDHDVVDVFVRDPYERFLSGVQTFLRNHSELDRSTALYFIDQHLFLNRHFCTQFHWIVNLQRHVPVNMRILPIAELTEITSVLFNQYERDSDLSEYFAGNLKVQFYLQLDKVLTENLLHKTVNMRDILTTLKFSYPTVYEEVVQRSKNICTVLE